jgi:hypothetical protein
MVVDFFCFHFPSSCLAVRQACLAVRQACLAVRQAYFSNFLSILLFQNRLFLFLSHPHYPQLHWISSAIFEFNLV